MIYPTTCSKPGELRLKTLESIWLQGKLKMWGRWSRISKSGAVRGVFARLLTQETLSKTALNAAIRDLEKAGISREELFSYFGDLNNQKTHSSLFYCTDAEALLIDSVIGKVFADTPGLIDIIKVRYITGKKKTPMAVDMQFAHPELSLSTCQRRIDTWLTTAELMLYPALNDACKKNISKTDKKSFDNLTEKYKMNV
jgi:hypothetical protein